MTSISATPKVRATAFGLERCDSLKLARHHPGSGRGDALWWCLHTGRVRQWTQRFRFRYALWLVIWLQIFATAADWAICISSPCRARDVGAPVAVADNFNESLSAGSSGGVDGQQPRAVALQCQAQYSLALAIRTAAMLLGYLVIFVAFFKKLSLLVTYMQQLLSPLAKRLLLPAGPRSLPADFWVGAASPDLFRETETVLHVSSKLTGLLFMTTQAINVCAYAAGVKSFYDRRVELSSLDAAFGCQGDKVCVAAGLANDHLLRMNALLLAMLVVAVVTSPELLWSHTMFRAQTRMNSRRLRRLRWQPWLVAVGAVAFASQAVALGVHRLMNDWTPAQVDALLAAQVLLSIYWIGAAWWCLLLQDAYAVLITPEDPEPSDLPGPPTRWQPGVVRRVLRLLHNPDVSLGQKQEALLMLQLVLWCTRVVSDTPVVELVAIYSLRAAVALLVFLVADKESSFQDPERCGHSFGLVIQASALRAALQGRKPVIVPRYSATIHRMQDTLAVSYKWQADEREIIHGLSLNMSDFQIDTLVEAIEMYGVRYVWLDKLSVPQDNCSEKDTLLARMMGVYAAARMTLAIRTCEENTLRYHQRAWTFQEFCSSSRLLVVTEEGGDEEDDQVAFNAQEDQQVMRLRSQCQTAMAELIPMWLRDAGQAVTTEQAVRLVGEYDKISKRLHCSHPGDKLRALWPLLANMPVESQRALVSLIKEVAAAAKMNPMTWLGQLFESNVAHKASMASMSIGAFAACPGGGLMADAVESRWSRRCLTLTPKSGVAFRQQLFTPFEQQGHDDHSPGSGEHRPAVKSSMDNVLGTHQHGFEITMRLWGSAVVAASHGPADAMGRSHGIISPIISASTSTLTSTAGHPLRRLQSNQERTSEAAPLVPKRVLSLPTETDENKEEIDFSLPMPGQVDDQYA